MVKCKFLRLFRNNNAISSSVIILLILVVQIGLVKGNSSLDQGDAITLDWDFASITSFNYPSSWLSEDDSNNPIEDLFDVKSIKKTNIFEMTFISTSNAEYFVIFFINDVTLNLAIKNLNQNVWIVKELLSLSDILGTSELTNETVFLFPRIAFSKMNNHLLLFIDLQKGSFSSVLLLEVDLAASVVTEHFINLFNVSKKLECFEILNMDDQIVLSWIASEDSTQYSTTLYQAYLDFFELELVNSLLEFRFKQRISLGNKTTNINGSSISISVLDNLNSSIGVFYCIAGKLEVKIIDFSTQIHTIVSSYSFPNENNKSIPYNVKANFIQTESLVVVTWLEVEGVYQENDNSTYFIEKVRRAALSLSNVLPSSLISWSIESYYVLEFDVPKFSGDLSQCLPEPKMILSPICATLYKTTDVFQYIYSYLKFEEPTREHLPSLVLTQYFNSMWVSSNNLGAVDATTYYPMNAFNAHFISIGNNKNFVVWVRDLGGNRVGLIYGEGTVIQKSNDSDIVALLFSPAIFPFTFGIGLSFILLSIIIIRNRGRI